MPRKVLFVATVVKGHISAFHLPYLEWFRKEGFETHVAASDDIRGAAIPFCDVFHPVPFDRKPFSPRNLHAYQCLKRVIENDHFDVIHCHTPVGGVLTRLAARKSRKKGTKVIYTAHGFAFYKGAPLWRTIFKPVEKFCAGFTDIIITINGEDTQYARKAFRSARTEYIPGVGVDLREYASDPSCRKQTRASFGLAENDFMVLCVGRLDCNKNQETAIWALADFLKKHPKTDIRLFLAGEGTMRKRLEQLCLSLHIQQHVRFLGFRKDIPALMCAADLYLQPSRTEGLPRAVMEAMAASLPVIASDVRGCRDLITPKGGFLCPVCDAASVSTAIESLIQNRSRRIRFGEYNRTRIQAFSSETVLSRMETIYRSAIASETKILHVLASSRFFGAEHVVADIICDIRQHTNIQLAYASPDGEISAALAARDIPFFPFDRRNPASLKKIIDSYRPDIIHAHDVRAGVSAALFARRCKIFSTIHVNSPDMRKKNIKATLFYIAARRFSRIFWVNRSAMEQFAYADKLSQKSEYLPNIVNVSKIRETAYCIAPSRSFAAVYVGRLEQQKNPLRLMRIFAGILKFCPDQSFAVIGSGSMEAETREYAKHLGIAEHVSFLGYLENPYAILSHARVMLMCSRFEGLPLGALEAGALGIPIVSARTDGLCEVIEDGINGFLSDEDETLISRAADLISDDALYERIRRNALCRAERTNDAALYRSKLLQAYFS